jgi:hypothetical protein
MNTATFAATATRFQFTLSSSLLVALQRAMAPAASGVHGLDKGATTWIARPLGRTVTCEAGTLWLTFDNESADVILEAGQSHRCAKASKLAIHALAAARVSVA